MINPIFMPYCENCDMADLSLKEIETSTWHIMCSHEGACKRITRLVEKVPTIDPVRKGYKINQHSYPAKWLCSECGAKHFDFSDKFCSECGVNVEEGEE